VRVTRLSLRGFRSYEVAEVDFGEGLTVVTGSNGAGKTNLLEALYFGCVGRSCRTTNEREIVSFGGTVARVEVACEDRDGEHELSVGFEPGAAKRLSVDGAAVERLQDSSARPLVAVFLPDRLELVKGTPSVRRAHLDQFVAALWPARTVSRRGYARALAQRNALIRRIRAGGATRDSLPAWDAELARHGMALMEDRSAAAAELAPRFAARAEELGLGGGAKLAYRPRSRAESAQELVQELVDRVEADIDRGFTGHGPHRDELALRRDGRDLRAYGSQGQQRLAVLSLLLTERQCLAELREAPPLLLLDDVMSELDADRRGRLVELLRAGSGQSVITTTELAHVPGAELSDVARLVVRDGVVLGEAPAEASVVGAVGAA